MSSIDQMRSSTDVLWPRALALAIDMMFISIVGSPSLYIYRVINIGQHTAIPLPGGISVSLSAIAIVAYFTLGEALYGATFGKRWMHLAVVTVDGEPIRFWQALTRNVVRLVDYAVLLISVLVTSFSRWHQRLGDYTAQTIVVSDESLPRPDMSAQERRRKLMIVVLVMLTYYALLIKSSLL